MINVGEIVETDDLRITYLSSGQYESSSIFIQPKDGYMLWRFEFKIENISEKDQGITDMMDWECYADNVIVDQRWPSDDDGLGGTLSSGRTAKGSVYFEVPVDAKDIELEYEIDFWNEDKIVFIGK